MNNTSTAFFQNQKFERFPSKLIEALRTRLAGYESFQFTTDDLERETNASINDITDILKILETEEFLQTMPGTRCPYCHKDLEDEHIEASHCFHCGVDFETEDRWPESYDIYYRTGERGRDVKWILALHGMNTSGKWQQEFSWFLQNLYGYSIPVAIYKYGNIKISPLMRFRQRTYVERLVKNIHRLRDQFTEPHHKVPDVIAHSFGTWLLAKMLMENEDIKVGRVILTGSIIRPDFPWQSLIQRKQVEAVLCHHSIKDCPVKLAHWFIPGSGPSGVSGFNDRGNVFHIGETDFGHSDYFEDDRLAAQVINKWTPFLTRPINALKGLADPDPGIRKWTPSKLRFISQFLLFIFLLAQTLLVLGAVPALVTGYKEIFKYFYSSL